MNVPLNTGEEETLLRSGPGLIQAVFFLKIPGKNYRFSTQVISRLLPLFLSGKRKVFWRVAFLSSSELEQRFHSAHIKMTTNPAPFVFTLAPPQPVAADKEEDDDKGGNENLEEESKAEVPFQLPQCLSFSTHSSTVHSSYQAPCKREGRDG